MSVERAFLYAQRRDPHPSADVVLVVNAEGHALMEKPAVPLDMLRDQTANAATRSKRLTDKQREELVAVIAMTSQNNAIANARQIPAGPEFSFTRQGSCKS